MVLVPKLPPEKIAIRDERDDDALPERLELSDKAFDAFSQSVLNPPAPNAALIALFKKA